MEDCHILQLEGDSHMLEPQEELRMSELGAQKEMGCHMPELKEGCHMLEPTEEGHTEREGTQSADRSWDRIVAAAMRVCHRLEGQRTVGSFGAERDHRVSTRHPE
jgi:hypothetical protein